jgi:multidrug resistance efflux pump
MSEKAMFQCDMSINGMNPKIAGLKAQLEQARYYLDNTTMVAPADGRIVNLQVRQGMVSGIYRIGGIADFIEDAEPYVLATYYQPQLKYVKTGMPAEVALDAYPGQIFRPSSARSGRPMRRGSTSPLTCCRRAMVRISISRAGSSR